MARNNKYTSLNFNEIYEKKVVNYNNSSPSTTTKSPSSTSSASYLSTANKSYSSSAASRLTHGGMLVLSRPSPKPQPQLLQTPPLSPSPKQPPPLTPSSSSTHSPTAADTDAISLRPLGKTTTVGGTNLTPPPQSSSSPGSMMEIDVGSGSLPKSDKFVPPHLRPGYVSKEVAKSPPSHGPEFAHRPRSGNHRPGSGHGYQYHGSPDNHRPGSGHGYHHHGSPNKYVDNGRVKYGGGGYQYHGSPDNYRPGSANGFKENGRVNYGGGYGGGGPDPGYLNRPRSGGNRPNSSGCSSLARGERRGSSTNPGDSNPGF